MNVAIKVSMLAGAVLLGSVSVEAAPFGQYYAFGDSLSDNGRVLRETGYDATTVVGPAFFNAAGIYQNGYWSNAPNFTEVVPSLIGVPYVPSNGFAIGGAQSVHQDPSPLLSPVFAWGLPDQIDTFASWIGRFASNDLINLWIGYNDLTQIPATATQAEQNASIAGIVSNTASAITRLAALGGREFVVFDQQTYRPDGRGSLAQELNVELGAALQPLSVNGLDILYFDVNSILNGLRANPAAFGFAADAGTISCAQVPACAQNGNVTGLENQYISPEGIHLTGPVNTIVAQALASELNASVPVTEPGTLALLVSGLGGMIGMLHWRRVPLGRLSRPEETAAAALSLASDESSSMAGSDLHVGGGMAQVREETTMLKRTSPFRHPRWQETPGRRVLAATADPLITGRVNGQGGPRGADVRHHRSALAVGECPLPRAARSRADRQFPARAGTLVAGRVGPLWVEGGPSSCRGRAPRQTRACA